MHNILKSELVEEKERTQETAHKKHWCLSTQKDAEANNTSISWVLSCTAVREWGTWYWTNISPISSTPRVRAEILERYKLCGHKLRHRDATSLCSYKGEDNAMSCHHTGYGRLRQVEHTHASNLEALKERKYGVVRSREVVVDSGWLLVHFVQANSVKIRGRFYNPVHIWYNYSNIK